MSIINHIVDYFTLFVISRIACKKESNNKVRDLIIIIATVGLTCINCVYNPKIQPIQLIISIVSCVIINKINVTNFIQVGLLYFLMSVLQSYVFTVLTIWDNGDIVKFYNLIGCALLILISFGILDLKRYNANGQKSVPVIIFLLISVCIEGLTMAAIKSIVNRYSVVLSTLEKFTLTLSFPIIMILMFLYFNQYFGRKNEAERSSFLEKLLDIEKKHYNEQEYTMQKLRRFKHDANNYYSVISGLIKEKNYSELESFIISGKQIIDDIDFQIYSGNVIGDAVLNEKLRVSTQKGIRFEYDGIIPNETQISNTELASLLSNLVDNAIEAAEKSADKFVKVVCRCDRKFLKITVVNSYSEKVDFNKLTTTKTDKENHGYGLQIIKSVINAYDGSIVFKTSEDEFTAEILIRI